MRFSLSVHIMLSMSYLWKGWQLHRRLHFIENNWTYFLGFGFPLALATYMIPNYLLSGAIFSIFFPLFIISANEAQPRNGCWSVCLFSPFIFLSKHHFFAVIFKYISSHQSFGSQIKSSNLYSNSIFWAKMEPNVGSKDEKILIKFLTKRGTIMKTKSKFGK